MSSVDTTKVVRISLENYQNLNKIRKQMALKLGKKKVTYDELLKQALDVAEILVAGREIYEWQGELFEDVSEAWSYAVEQSLTLKKPITEPRVLLDLGKDDTFEVPK